MSIISKTDFLLYRECHKNAWLKINKPDIYYTNELSDFERSIIETGNEVELLARQLFPTGILIEGRDLVAQEKTAELVKKSEEIGSTGPKSLKNSVQTIFQPVFLKDGFLAAVDVLQYDQATKTYTIYEIKASNQIKEKLHLYDLAFQVNLLKMAGVNIGRINLLHLNPEYVRKGELDIIKLFVIDNVTDQVTELLEKVTIEMHAALEYLSKAEEPRGHCDCIYKGRSSHCTTFHHSNPEVPDYSIHDIARIGLSKKKLTELIDSNIFHVHEVPEHIELSEIQMNQVNAAVRAVFDADQKGPHISKKDKIAQELGSLQFPLYFIDYETFPSAVPRFDGFSPYQQIPFQYSLHIVEKMPNSGDTNLGDVNISEPIHREFLHTGSNDPTIPFIESLKNDIGKIGSIIVWNKKFECKINDELAKRALQSLMPESLKSEVKKFIDDINSRVYDLMDIFSKQHYVHKDFQGSTSIKAVLPVLIPELSYKKLEIREGGTASMKWNEMTTRERNDEKTKKKIKLSQAEADLIAKNLLKYCALDTYAMYAIWKHLYEL
jgi:hypothetical protein